MRHRPPFAARASERTNYEIKTKKAFFKWLMRDILLLIRWRCYSSCCRSVHPSIHPWARTRLPFIYSTQKIVSLCLCRTVSSHITAVCVLCNAWKARHTVEHVSFAHIRIVYRRLYSVPAFKCMVLIWLFILYLPHSNYTLAHACSIRVEKTHKFLSIFYHSI